MTTTNKNPEYSFFRYVPHHMVAVYEDNGWRVVGNGGGLGSHRHWSVLMEYYKKDTPNAPEDKHA